MIKWMPLALVFISFLSRSYVHASSKKDTNAKCTTDDDIHDIIDTVLKRYDKRIRPGQGSGKPVDIAVNLLIKAINNIDSHLMFYKTHILFRQEWNDHRLAFRKHNYTESIRLEMNYAKEIWLPDTYFMNDYSGESIDATKHSVLIDVNPDGHVFFSQRLILTLKCPMDLHMFPHDTQECPIVIESFAYTLKDLNLMWKDVDAIQLPNNDTLEWHVKGISWTNTTSVMISGTYVLLEAKITISRLLSFFIIQVYGPSFLLVALSWVAFWIDIRAVPARASLGIICVMTVSTQSTGIRTGLPHVPYIKVIDIWMFTCLFFTFGALVEFAFASHHARQLDKRRKKEEILLSNSHRTNSAIHKMKEKKHYFVEKISRFAFPLAFAIFNVIYWLYVFT